MSAENPASPLDNPVWGSLNGAHRAFAEYSGSGAARYRLDTNVFAALSDPEDPAAWADLAALVGPGQEVWLTGLLTPPAGWGTVAVVPGVQLDGRAVRVEHAPDAVRLGPADVEEMTALVKLTEPGPFLPGTVGLGTYLGIRHEGRLVAMAGERMRPPGWTEISAVCTHPDFRGRGLAARLVRSVAAGIRDRGELPFLHAAAGNTGAVRLYGSMGFTLRREPVFIGVRSPEERTPKQ